MLSMVEFKQRFRPESETVADEEYAASVECQPSVAAKMLQLAWIASRFDSFPEMIPLKTSSSDTAFVRTGEQWRLRIKRGTKPYEIDRASIDDCIMQALNLPSSNSLSKELDDLSIWGDEEIADVVNGLASLLPSRVMHASLSALKNIEDSFASPDATALQEAKIAWALAIKDLGYDLDRPPHDGGEAALVALARRGDVNEIRALVIAGADISINGNEALQRAVDHWRATSVDVLLQLGADAGCDRHGVSVLSNAIDAIGGHAPSSAVEVIRHLCRHGIDPDQKDDDGRSPMDHFNHQTEDGQYLGEFGQAALDAMNEARQSRSMPHR